MCFKICHQAQNTPHSCLWLVDTGLPSKNLLVQLIYPLCFCTSKMTQNILSRDDRFVISFDKQKTLSWAFVLTGRTCIRQQNNLPFKTRFASVQSILPWGSSNKKIVHPGNLPISRMWIVTLLLQALASMNSKLWVKQIIFSKPQS